MRPVTPCMNKYAPPSTCLVSVLTLGPHPPLWPPSLPTRLRPPPATVLTCYVFYSSLPFLSFCPSPPRHTPTLFLPHPAIVKPVASVYTLVCPSHAMPLTNLWASRSLTVIHCAPVTHATLYLAYLPALLPPPPFPQVPCLHNPRTLIVLHPLLPPEKSKPRHHTF